MWLITVWYFITQNYAVSDFHALVHYGHEATYFFIKITWFHLLRLTKRVSDYFLNTQCRLWSLHCTSQRLKVSAFMYSLKDNFRSIKVLRKSDFCQLSSEFNPFREICCAEIRNRFTGNNHHILFKYSKYYQNHSCQ